MATEATILDRIRALERRIDYLERGQAVGITGTDQTIKGSHDRLDAILGAGNSTFNLDADNLESNGGVLQFSAAAAGDGLSGGGGDPLAVNVDDSTIEIDSDALRVKGLTRSFFLQPNRGWVINEQPANSIQPYAGAGFPMEDGVWTAAFGTFLMPVDYASGLSVIAVACSDGETGDMYVENRVFYATEDEDWDAASDAEGYTAIATQEELDYVLPVESSAEAGHLVTCRFTRDAYPGSGDTAEGQYVFFMGWIVSYAASR
jgi:hypothetical protein